VHRNNCVLCAAYKCRYTIFPDWGSAERSEARDDARLPAACITSSNLVLVTAREMLKLDKLPSISRDEGQDRKG
jgi:hypothetical protein